MMSERLCDACGKPLGSNPKCDTCLAYLVSRGPGELSKDEVEESYERERAWEAGRGSTAPEKLLEDVQLLARMVRDYLRGNYREIPWAAISSGAFAILYAVNPFDLMPDFIPGMGYLDDLAIVALVIRSIQSDLEAYRVWIKGLGQREGE